MGIDLQDLIPNGSEWLIIPNDKSPKHERIQFSGYLLAATVSHLAVGLLSAAFPDSVAKSQPLKCPCRFLTR